MKKNNENDGISQKSLDAFTAIVEDRLANVATKECISELRQTIVDELEVKVFVMEDITARTRLFY